jgi:hypothetical protein
VTHKTASEVEVIVARLSPKPDAQPLVRRIASPISRPADAPVQPPEPATPSRSVLPSPPAPHALKPLAPDRFRIQFTISENTREKLRLTQDLLRHSVQAGDLEAIFDRALSALLADIEKRKLAIVPHPRTPGRTRTSTSRHIPAAVTRAVWARDKGRCAFIGTEGRCRERSALELHHVKPFAAGGTAIADNIQLRCRAHNVHEAHLYFGNDEDP